MKKLLPTQESFDFCVFQNCPVKVEYKNPDCAGSTESLQVEGTVIDQMEDSIAVQLSALRVALIPKSSVIQITAYV